MDQTLLPAYGRFIVEDRHGRQSVLGSLGRDGLFVPQPAEMQPDGFRPLQQPWRVVAVAEGAV